MKSKFNDFITKLKSGKKLQYIIIGLMILVLIFAFTFDFDSDKSKSNTSNLIDNYVKSLENKLEKTLSKVDGAGEVSVVITVESGMETILAMKTIKTETSSGIEIEQTPILVNGKTVVLQENFPKITGVLIVAKGGNNISVINKIQQAVVSLLDINLDQIEILTMK